MADSDMISPTPSPKGMQDESKTHPSTLKSRFMRLFKHPRPLSSEPISQLRCGFLSVLPLEIRRQIYIEIVELFGTCQHVFLLNNNLTHMRCVSPESHIPFQKFGIILALCPRGNEAYRRKVRNGWEIIPLLLSCRQIYLEFIELVYPATTFYLNVPAARRLIATVPTSFISSSRIHLEFRIDRSMYQSTGSRTNASANAAKENWEAFWRETVALQIGHLLVEIEDDEGAAPEQNLLQPLKQSKVQNIEVWLPWQAEQEIGGDDGHTSFKILRPPKGTDLTVEENFDKACQEPPVSKKIFQSWRRQG
ncbi:hypothetical protein ONS95_005225 [Cadophora gregata]|uniref:uncharacterized protein n=1 Tax=Cadophora gregata TaxID=51156 RepID=UPI0026DAE216|nr:uncharacterized protein ONS95_005225 [Cadophora gregata]KAK0104964.1 hypothetical protein ONS95_005225 [Cadophora gregata]